jgi:hypothetical protein
MNYNHHKMDLRDTFRRLTLDNQALLLTCAQIACVAEKAGKQEQMGKESDE